MNNNWRVRRVRLWIYKHPKAIQNVLECVGEAFGYMDDSWPDMRDEMISRLVDLIPESTESECEWIVEKFLENSGN